MSNAMGIVRQVDNVGRIVIPSEMRSTLGIQEGSSVSITTNGASITISKYEPGCTFCDSLDGLDSYMGKKVCRKCKDKLTGGGE